MKDRNGLIKIGQLAAETGVNVSTLKYYIKEDLIRPALKTGRNMSWYDRSCIDTVNMIRILQKERFYPLHVIRSLLQAEGGQRLPEMAFLDAIHKVDENAAPDLKSLSQAAAGTGLSEEEILTLMRAGIITGRTAEPYGFDEDAIAVMGLVKRRLSAGIPLAQSIAAFQIYDRAVRNAAREDIASFVGNILTEDLTAESGTKKIRISDETLDGFIELRRKNYNRRYGRAYVERMYRFFAQCRRAARRLPDIFRKAGLTEEAAFWEAGMAGEIKEPDACAVFFRMFAGENARDEDLVGRIRMLAEQLAFFKDPEKRLLGTDGLRRTAADVMRFLWLSMAPDVLDLETEKAAAAENLRTTLRICCPQAHEALYNEIVSCAAHGGGHR